MPEIIEQLNDMSSGNCSIPQENRTQQIDCSLYNHIRSTNISYGNLSNLTSSVKAFVEESIALCQPEEVHICDGSDEENKMILRIMLDNGTIIPLPKYDNCWLARTNPADVARVESRTFICTDHINDAIPTPKPGVRGTLGNWISSADFQQCIQERFPSCMKGRTMYIIPFSMGPLESPLSKIGIEVTDSPYVVASMRIMTRMGAPVLKQLRKQNKFVRALHSVGIPNTGVIQYTSWPCDPERTIILHKPSDNFIASYGSGYGGNSLLGKKCFALRVGSTIAKREGWLAEHMLILGITNPYGEKKYITAAFPSACGKTNLAMLKPSLPKYKVECVGDDIAWMKFDNKGILRAINPENGFFGVAPGTSQETNPIAMATIFKNTIFTNVAYTSDGGVYWEGMESSLTNDVEITDWLGAPWTKECGKPAAHPNSRFCTPAKECPIIDSKWEDPQGVPISAILFGGRRPAGVPLVYESSGWAHGVFIGASIRSESTAAAEYKTKVIMHDPFAMRPFFGYNFGHYVQHWLSMESRGELPKIFHVNWFRKDSNGRFIWPGYGENIRVLEWILRRCKGELCYTNVAIGKIPAKDDLNLENMTKDTDYGELFSLPKEFWLEEVAEVRSFFESQVGLDLPQEMYNELRQLHERIAQI